MKGQATWIMLTWAALFLLAAGFSSCAKPQAQPLSNPSDMVMTSCLKCHSAERICDALGKKDKDAWNTTVTRMVEKGASVESGNIPVIVDYLTNLKPGSPPVCK
jgi:hypothetical protein